MRNIRKGRLLAVSLLCAALLSGCTYESGDKHFALTQEEDKGVPQTENAAEWLKRAIEKGKTDPEGQKFWYKGHVKNQILSRSTTSMFSGTVIQPDGYNADTRIARQDYQYYRMNDKSFIRVKDHWVTAREEQLPFDVLKGFEDWLPFMDRAVQLKDEELYAVDCIPFQVKISAAEWLQNSTSPLFEPLRQQLAGRTDMEQILNDSTVKMTVWIGREDHLIHQYQTWIILPLPGAGYMDQEVFFSFYKYNPNLKLNPPENVEKYLLH